MPLKKSKEQYIEEANNNHKNKYDYSLIKELPKRDTRVNIICPNHGIFEQSFNKHLIGNGCKNCADKKLGKERIEKANMKFINKANIIHMNKYDYSKSIYISARDNMIIICKKHGDFEQSPNRHLSGSGCKKCANDKTKEIMSMPWEIYKEQLEKIHNNIYDYSNVIWRGSDNEINVKCNTHGNFTIRAQFHKNGTGCQKCSKENKIQYNKHTTEIFIEMAIKIWANTYDYSKVDYKDSNNKVIIICKTHGEFEQIPPNHLKYGCGACGRESNKRNIYLKDKCKSEFISKANDIHENIYDYSSTHYHNAKSKVIVICEKHSEFSITPNNHLRGKGCPKCINKTEQKLYDELYKYYPLLTQQFKVEWCKYKNKLPYDFVLEDNKIIIELDGKHHFKDIISWNSTLKETHKNDIYKMKCANDNGYSVVRIFQPDVWNDLYDWLTELIDNIEKIKLEQLVQNVYMCKNNEYAIFA